MISRHLPGLCFDPGVGRQMRFISGPRQVGKSTLVKTHLREAGCAGLYYNWDLRKVRDRYREEPHFFHTDARGLAKGRRRIPVAFDEMHKYPKWKNLLKDFFDSYEDRYRFLVTGSARLDLFRKSGDSLTGRYFLYRLLPVSLFELAGAPLETPGAKPDEFVEAILEKRPREDEFDTLLRFGGFPEPLERQKAAFSAAWREQYVDTLIREDLRDLTRIHELENIAALLGLLPGRIGSPLSLSALARDLSVSFKAVRNYMRALDLACAVFSIRPYSGDLARALKKEPKVYLADWTVVRDPGARFENYVAAELRHRAQLWSHQGEDRFDVRYVRERGGAETDFLITRGEAPYLMIEAKIGGSHVAGHHVRQARKLGGVPVVQVLARPGVVKTMGKGIAVVSASRFFA